MTTEERFCKCELYSPDADVYLDGSPACVCGHAIVDHVNGGSCEAEPGDDPADPPRRS
jgi:hypothetical protein